MPGDPIQALLGSESDPIDSGSAVDFGFRPKRKHGDLQVEVIRELSEDDVAALRAQKGKTQAPSISKIRTAHHQLARLLASGMRIIDVSYITGYSPVYISQIQGNPLFQDLLTHYADVQEMAHRDSIDSMQQLGMDTLAVLRKRLEEAEDSFTINQLHEQINLLLVKPMAAAAEYAKGHRATAGGEIKVTFVNAKTPQAGDVIEGELVAGGGNGT